ncbi:MAG TPA: cyclic nucleotide-binding domain-containing protein, partial [Burkholderiales bacterium]
VKLGEIFGELAAITQAPRTATAVAKTDCKLIALDDAELEGALAKKPAFALMLMSILIARLRETIARLTAAGALAKGDEWQEAVAFDPKRLTELVSGLSNDAPLYFQQGRQIMGEGQKAVLMYAVLKGRVAISIGGRVVERLGPGGAFGEAALVDQAPRLATAVAETDCELQPITRNAFLALVKVSPQFAYSMLSSLAERLRFLTARL